MSRILRRPMFRGGRVDSRGTGITSGLGYAKGGQVQPRQNFLWGGLAYIPQALAWGSRMLPAIGRGWKAARYWKPGSLGTWGRTKSLLTPGKGLNARMAKSGEGAGFRIGSFAKENPLTTFGIASAIPQTTYGGFRGAKKGVEVAPEVGKSYIDLILPGDQSGWFKKEEEGPPEETPINPELAAALAKIEERDALIKLMEEQARVKKNKKLTKEEKVAKIKENEEMFREVYGSGKSEDISAMLMNFAGKALKPEATVKSAFGEFFEEESKRPSERKKYKDAAAQAAIQSFLTGEKTMAEIDAFMRKTDYQLKEADKYKKAKPPFMEGLTLQAKTEGKSVKNEGVISRQIVSTYGPGKDGGPLPEKVEDFVEGMFYTGVDPNNKNVTLVYEIVEGEPVIRHRIR